VAAAAAPSAPKETPLPTAAAGNAVHMHPMHLITVCYMCPLWYARAEVW
jgi:hypothetical protein